MISDTVEAAKLKIGVEGDEVIATTKDVAKLADEIDKLGNESQKGTDKVGKGFKKAKDAGSDLKVTMQEYSKELLYNQASAKTSKEVQDSLARALGLVKTDTEEAMRALANVRGEYDRGEISAKEYADKVNELNQRFDVQQKEATESTTKLQSMGSEFGAAKMKLAAFTGALVAFGYTAKKAYDFSRDGAELDRTKTKFGNLSQEMGTTSDTMLHRLRKETGGLVGDFELIGLATDVMGLKFAKNTDQVARLSNVAGKLDMDMNQLSLTLANQTKMRFDQLGVAVEGFDEKLGRFKAQGLGDGEAFLEAFLAQSEEQVVRLGDVSDDSISGFMRLETAMKNIWQNMQENYGPSVAEAAGWLADLVTASERMRGEFGDTSAEILVQTESWEEYKNRLNEVLASKSLYIDQDGQLQATTIQSAQTLQKWRDEIEIIIPDMYDAARAAQVEADAIAYSDRVTGAYSDRLHALAGAYDYVMWTSGEYVAAQDIMNRSLGELQLLMSGPLGKEMEDFAKSQEDLAQEAGDLQGRIDELNGKSWLTSAQKTELEENKKKLEEIGQQIQNNADAHEEANKQILFDLATQRMSTDGVIDDVELDALNALAVEWGLIDEATGLAIDAMDEYIVSLKNGQLDADEFAKRLGVIPDQIDVVVNVKGVIDPRLNGLLGAQAINRMVDIDSGDPDGQSAKALGGTVFAGTPYLTGERGPEPFIPNSDGTIITNDDLVRALTGMQKSGGVNFEAGAIVVQAQNSLDVPFVVDEIFRKVQESLI